MGTCHPEQQPEIPEGQRLRVLMDISDQWGPPGAVLGPVTLRTHEGIEAPLAPWQVTPGWGCSDPPEGRDDIQGDLDKLQKCPMGIS